MRFRSLIAIFGLLELGTLIAIGVYAGFLWAVGVVIGTMFIGANLLRAPGLRISGVLLLIPGLITDLLALVFLLPGPRRWVARAAQAVFLRGVPTGGFQRVVFTTAQGGMPPPGWAPPPGWTPPGAAPASGGVVQADVLDVKPSASGELPDPDSSND